MSVPTIAIPTGRLLKLGLRIADTIHYQLTPPELVQQSLERGEGTLDENGALVISTGTFTGRSPKDRFIVRDEITADQVDWNDINLAISESQFDSVFKQVTQYINKLPEIWIRDCFAGADDRFRLSIRVITASPAMNLFPSNMFIQPTADQLDEFSADWHIISAPELQLNTNAGGIRQSNAVVISFTHKLILIAGTGYTGEMKKSIFGVLNFLLPVQHGVLPMHCAANIGKDGNTALFFGLSGTGKTTLSTDLERRLIGDDEHGWTADSIFNFEGGCYAKCLGLDEKKEPAIYHAVRPGALVENTVFFPGTNQINFNNSSITENTRVSYPLSFIPGAADPAIGAQPKHIFFLTCDAHGVLPPISKLSNEQAMYHFISGYTAKVAGTESGIKEPKTVFSACFGAPFMPLHPAVYADMLGQKLRQTNAQVWLVNTGWTGGPYGTGQRISLSFTRKMISAALQGVLDTVPYRTDPAFGLQVPLRCPGVPDSVLQPELVWENNAAYAAQASILANQFAENFNRYSGKVSPSVTAAGPVIK